MSNNASNLTKLVKDEVVYAANWAYGKLMGMLGLVLVYLLSLWGLLTWSGYGSINIAMWVFVILLTKVYWQPNVGGMAALGEFFYQKDDPEKKSVWRLYLLLIISAIAAGYVAITVKMIGAPTAFPQWVLVIILCVVLGLVLPGSQLDKWLPRITAAVIVLALAGLIPQMNPHYLKKMGITVSSMPQSEIDANNIGDKDVAIQDARRKKQLKWTEALMECKLPEKSRSTWSVDQGVAYKSLCETNGNITLEEMGKFWPSAKQVWEDSYGGKKPIKAGGAAAGSAGGKTAFSMTDPATWTKWVSENPVYALILLILHIPVFMFAKWAWNRRDGAVVTNGKATEGLKAGPTLLWLALLGGAGYGGYQILANHPDVPSMETVKEVITGSNARAIPNTSTVRYEPTLMLGTSEKYEALYRQYNPHSAMPQDAYHGTKRPLGTESYVADNISLRVLLSNNSPEWNLLFNGQCVVTTDPKADTPKACHGYWSNEGGSQKGVFYLKWERNGQHFVINMYAEAVLPNDSSMLGRALDGVEPIANVMVRLKQ